MIGKSISHYQILDRLGSGGMGKIRRPETMTLWRHVAIKVCRIISARCYWHYPLRFCLLYARGYLRLDDFSLSRREKQVAARGVLKVLPVPSGAHEAGGRMIDRAKKDVPDFMGSHLSQSFGRAKHSIVI